MDTNENEMQETQYFEIDQKTMDIEDRFSPSATSAKIERRYELQRKIDEELRKLQFSEAMEQPENSQETDSVVSEAMDIASQGEYVEKYFSNGDNLLQDHNDIPENSATHEPVSATSPDEINIQQQKQPDSDEEVILNGVESAGFIVQTGQESDHAANDEVAVASELDDASDYVANSSTMTSPTTTTGTFTLPTHSPGTEEDLPEDIFFDQVPSTFRDQLPVVSATSPQEMDVSEMSSDVFLGQERSQSLSNTDVGAGEILEYPEHSELISGSENNEKYKDAKNLDHTEVIDNVVDTHDDAEIPLPTIVLPEIGCEVDAKLDTDNIEIVRVEPPEAFCGDNVQVEESSCAAYIESDEEVSHKMKETEAEVVTESDISSEAQTRETDGDITQMETEETTNNIVGSLIVDDANELPCGVDESNEANLSESQIELSDAEVVDNIAEVKTSPEGDINKADTEEFPEPQERNDDVSDGQMRLDQEFDDAQVEVAMAPQEVTDDSSDRKISTDEDEYSGYDIDICEPVSYQEEVSLGDNAGDAASEASSSADEYEVTKPYSVEGEESFFVDVKYSVGNQIGSQLEGDADDVTPTEEKENLEYPNIVPWGNDGVLLSVDTQNPNGSFRSDKAESDSSSSKSTLSDTVAYVEQSEKIAENAVKNAIEAAYEIILNVSDNDENDKVEMNSIKETPQSETEHPDVEMTERNDYQTHSAENPALNEVETEITLDGTSPVIEGARLTPLDDDNNADSKEADLPSEETAVEVVADEVVEVDQSKEADITAVVAQNENLIITQGDISNKDAQSQNIPEITLEKEATHSVSQAVEDSNNEGNKDLLADISEDIKDTEEENEEMVKIHESSGTARNLPERISYSPAHSQRNTEATKWFGQSTSEDKIWMKPRGKVDENAEQERKKLIKAMTRKHNPKLIPKWQPPTEKDPTENLDAKQKASLQKYEERRRSKSDAAMDNGNYSYQPVVSFATNTTQSTDKEPQNVLRESIVIESVVHSKDAISVWESRLSEKHHKEELERKRLSVGKKKRERASSDIGRQRRDSNSSVSSNTSGVLPTSEHIERESMNISKVRSRWRNIEEETSRAKSPTNFTKQPPRRSFTVNAPHTFRSNQKPSPAKQLQRNLPPIVAKTHDRPPIISSATQSESFIDREIREAAEREERWKQEQWEKASEVSAASSEDVFPDQHIPPPSTDPEVVTTIYSQVLPADESVGLDILNDAGREELWKEERLRVEGNAKKVDSAQRNPSKDSSGIGSITGSEILSPPPQFARKTNKDLDMESLSSYGSSETGNELPSPPSLYTMAQDKIDLTKKLPELTIHHQNFVDSTDSGIECGISKSPASAAATSKSLTQAKASTSPLSPISLPPPVTEEVTVATNSATVSSAPPLMEYQSNTDVNHTQKSEPPIAAKQEQCTEDKDSQKPNVEKTISSPKKEYSAPKRGGPVFKNAVPFEITSSKKRLQTVMEKEMQEAAEREEEWRRQQLELVNQGVDVTAHHIVHSTREIRTPTSSNAPPPVNVGDQAPEPRVIKSLFADDRDESPVQFTEEDSSKGYRNREVKKALKVPKRKSTLAMRWEEGAFQNSLPEDD